MSAGDNIYSQNVQQKATRQSSLEAFNRGDFERAYFEFLNLLETYPKDPLYKYYAGVSLIKIGREPEKALLFLLQSTQGSAVVRTVPADVVFWQGRAHQLCGQFTEAESSFNEFTSLAGKKRAREYGVPDFIQQCHDHKGFAEGNELSGTFNKKNEPLLPENDNIAQKTSITADQMIIQEREALPQDYDKILTEALEYQAITDSLKILSLDLGKKIEGLDSKGKAEFRSRIAATESLAADYQERADQMYEKAQKALNRVDFAAEKMGDQLPIAAADTIIRGNVAYDINKPENIDTVKSDSSEIKITDDKSEVLVKEPVKQANNEPQMADKLKIEKVSAPQKPAGMLSLFSIEPKKIYKTDEKIPVDASIPSGLIYRIQVAVFRNPVSPSYFKGISPVYGFKVTGTDKTGYFAGMFRTRADAAKALVRVKQTGFKDAFIVAMAGGKAVSAERAAILEKEWGNKPLIDPAVLVAAASDTIPPTLSFRIEVARGSKPASEDLTETFKRMAGSRGLDIYTLDDGTNIYLIGHFITYESAEEYASLLARNGLRNARVTAWLGKKEIPVDTARQLFEKLE